MNIFLSGALSLAAAVPQGAPGGLPFLPRPKIAATGCTSLPETELRASCIRGAFFFESRELSVDAQASCASCHQPAHIGGQRRFLDDGRPKPLLRGRSLVRNRTPSLLDVGWKVFSEEQGGPVSFFWNGRSHSAANVSFWPLLASDELGVRLNDAEAFGGIDAVAQDLGVFLGTQRSGPSPFDDFLLGKSDALSGKLQDGLKAFVQAGCPECHGGQELNEVQRKKQNRVPLRYSDLPKEFFSDGEAVYSADAALAGKPAKVVVLQSVPQTLRNLGVHVGMQRYFGRFGQANTLSEFLKSHCEQFLEDHLNKSCEGLVRNKTSLTTLIEFIQDGLRSYEFAAVKGTEK